MKLRLPVRLKLAVLAGLRSVVQATLASGFLAVGAVFFSFSAQAEDDPVALEVAEDEDEAAVPVDDEAPAAGLGVSAAELNDSQAAALAEAEQEHAAELGINATSSAVSQAAIEAQDAAVSPAQAAGGSHADSFAAVPAADSPALTLPAAEGAVAPSLCAEGAADFATDYAPIKTASVAVLPQASTSLTLPEDVVMASSPVAEAAQTSSSSTSAAVSSSSSSGGAVACGGGAAGGGGGSSASFSASVPVTDVSSSGFDLPSDSVVSAEDPALSPSEPSPSLPDDSELVDTSPSSDSSSLSDAASLSFSLSASASSSGASSSSPAARAFSFKLLGSTGGDVVISEGSKTYSSCLTESATSITLAGGTLVIDAEVQVSPDISASAASFVQINQGCSLASSAISEAASTNTITLTGFGTYAVSGFSLGTGVVLDDAWAGVVRTSAAKNGITVSDLRALAKNDSSVELHGVSGYWADETNTYDTKLVLTNPESSPALKITDGYSSRTYTFSKSISGDGTFELNKDSGDVIQKYTFSGDISKWTGIFEDKSGFSSRLTFSGLANNINVQLTGVDKLTLTGSDLFTIANSFSVTGNVDAAGVGVDATRATGGVKLSPKSDQTRTTCSVTQAFNAGSNAVTVESGVTLSVGGLMTAGTFTNSGTVSLNGGASITGTLTNTGSLTLGGSATVGKIDGLATVTGALTLTGVENVYHSGAALVFGDSSTLTLGTGTYEVGNTFDVGNISGSILNILNDSSVSLAGLAPRQSATYSADTGIITIGGYNYKELEWSTTSDSDEWDHSTANWVSGSESERFYNGDSVSIGAYSVTTSGELRARDVSLDGTTLTIASGSSLSADAITISGTTTIDNQNRDSYVPEENSVTIEDGTNLTLRNTNISTSKVSGSLTVGGNSTLTLTHTVPITNLTINGGTVVTTKTGEIAPVSGTVTVNAGGTYRVGGLDGLGWGTKATGKIILEGQSGEGMRAILDLAGYRSTATTVLSLNGWTMVKNGTWNPFNTNNIYSQAGGTINVSGKENEISAAISFRTGTDPTFIVEPEGEVTMSGDFTRFNSNNAVLKKQGAGLLIITSFSSVDNVDNAVSVEGGTLRLAGDAGKVGSGSGSITLSSGTTLELAHTQDCTLSGNIVSASNATQTTLKVTGSMIETLQGEVSVTKTDIQRGTLSLTGSSMNSLGELSIASGAALNSAGPLSVGAVTNVGTMTIGAEGAGVSLTLGGLITNSGSLTLYLSGLTYNGTIEGLMAGGAVSDSVSGSTTNGFLGDTVYLIKTEGSGSLSVSDLPSSVTVNGEERTLSHDDRNVSMALSDTEKSVYFVREGNVVYADSGNDTEYASRICLSGGTLQLVNRDLNNNVDVSVVKDSTLSIGSGRLMQASSLSVQSGQLTLTGAGTYSITSGTVTAMTPGVTLAAGEGGFTGTVLLGSGVTINGNTDLSSFRNEGHSFVTMNGVTGWTSAWNGEETANIKLTDFINDNGTITYAWTNGAYSTDATAYTSIFSGTWRGEGTFVAKSSGGKLNYKYTGDISEWTGAFRLNWTASGQSNDLTFSGAASRVNAAIERQNGTLNITSSATGGVTFGNSINASSLTATTALTLNAKGEGTVETTDQISGALNAGTNSVTVGQNVSLTVTGKTTTGDFTNRGDSALSGGVLISGAVTNSGTLTIGGSETTISSSWTNESGGTLKFNSGVTVNSGVTLTNNGELILSSTLNNSGTLSFGADSTIGITDLSGFNCTYSDSSTGEGATSSGYLTCATLISGSGTIGADNRPSSFALDGQTYNIAYGDNTAIFSNSSAYYINAGDNLLYGAVDNSLSADQTTLIVLNGGTLSLGSENSLAKSTILYKSSTLALGSGAEFAASNIVSALPSSEAEGKIATNGQTLTLTGEGTYLINKGSVNFNQDSLNVTLGSGWTGTVQLHGGSGGHNLGQLRNDSLSTIEMYGVSGWTTNWSGTEAANIRLTDVVDSNGTTTYAWTNDAFSSTGYNTCTFSGKWSGQGTFVATTNNGDGRQNYTYSGDISDWGGQFRLMWNEKYAMTLTFMGAASVVNASIYKGTSTLNVVASAGGGTTFANELTVSSLTATEKVTFSAGGTTITDDITGALNASGQSVTVGEEVTLSVGGLTTARHFENAGTVTLEGGASISKTLVNKGSLTVGTGSNSPHLTIGAPIINSGDMTIHDGTVLTFAGDEVELVCSSSGSEFNDTAAGTSGASSNGFITKGNFYLILNQNGILTMSNSVVDSIIVNGVAVSATKDASGVHYTASQSEIASLDSTYFVNTGNVVYGASDNSAGNAKVTELCLTGGTLALASENLASGVSLLVTGDSTVAIGAGRTLSEEVLTMSRGSLTLTGAGTYRMAAKDFGASAALTEGVVLGSTEAAAFTGTVLLSSGTTLSGTDLSRLTNESNSTVTLNGVSGYLNNGEIGTKLVLMNDGAVPALAINNGTNGDTRTFSGSISGTGTMARTNRMEGNNTVESGGTQNFVFTGNIAEWTGVFDNQVSKTTNLTFGGEATEVNATLKHTAKGGGLNVTTADNTNVSFNGGMSVTSLTAGKNSTITLIGNSKVSGAVNGSFEVGASGSLTVGSAAELTDSTVSDGGSVAELTGLTVRAGGSVTLNGTATATGAVIVENGGYLALGRNGLTLSGSSASLTLKDGAIVALQGWTATTTETIDYGESGVMTTGYSGGKLFTKSEDATGSTSIGTNVGFKVVKDGASFTGDRVTVNDNGTVTITDAVFYNVANNGQSVSVETAKNEAKSEGKTLDYINVLGILTGVNDTNIASLGVGASDATGVYGDGTLSLDGILTDGYHLSSFTGTIAIGAGSTFETDGNVGRKIKLEGGTLRATADMTLKNVSAAGGTANKIEVYAGKAVIITSQLGESGSTVNITKTGEGTLTLGAINDSGAYIRGTMYGDLTVEGGEVVLVTPNDNGGESGTVVGNITIKAGGAVTANGIDPLGYSDSTWSMTGSPNCTKTLTMSGEENAYAILNIASGKHVTLSTEVYMNGYAQINGRLLNAWSSTRNTGGEQTAYIKASGLGNVINADFYLRHHALFEVEENGELSLNGSILKFTLGGAFDKPIFRKAGAGTLILDSPTATTLYNLRIEAGEVRISTDLSFAAASALEDFSMTKDSRFTVVDDGRFTYGGWTYEMKDGSSKVATVTASSTASGSLLSLSGITIADTKLTNTAANTSAATNTLTISANLDNVAFTQDNGGSVTIANAADGAGTQHLSSLAVNAGRVTLNNARLDAAKVASGATLNFTKGTAITLGSTIQNAGTVALTGTAESAVSFTVSDLSGFETYGTAGYQDSRYMTSEGGSDTGEDKEYNGFFLGNQYYLVKNAGGNVDLSSLAVSYANKSVTVAQVNGETDADKGSYYFTTSEKDTKYYINNSTQNVTNYTYSANAENSMYGGYLEEGEAAHFATSGIVMNAEGGRLILATNLREDEGNAVTSGIIMNQAGSITVNENVTLKQSSLSGEANATLKGDGNYDVGGTVLSDIAKGFTDTAWKGTVQVSGEATGMKLSYMGHSGSTVQMTGVHGTLEDTVTDDKIYAMDIVLVNGDVLVNGEKSALALGFTANNRSNITFSGEMSGDGNMKLGGATAQTTQDITFSGDISKWTGAFESGQGTVNLTLKGGATAVNAGILKAKDDTTKTLNLIIDGAANRTLSAGISVDSLVVTEGAASGDTRIALTKGGYATMVDLTANQVILEVRGEAFTMYNGLASLSENGNSGIDIADSNGVVKTTIRTNVPTTPSAQAEEGDSGERVSTFSGGTITNAVFSYDATADRAKIVGLGTGRIENTIIDLQEGTTLELSNMVLADTVKITDAPATMISTNNVVELGSNNAKVNTTEGRDLGGVTLQKTGSKTSAEGALENVSGRVYTIDFTGIQNVDITSGTLTFDFNAYSGEVNGRTLTGFDLFYELGKTYDYIAVNFAADSGDSAATIDYANVKVQSQITNGQGATATSTGYYIVNENATSGVVVYFDAMALPEPTTSTLALLALTALCARRRRTQATR